MSSNIRLGFIGAGQIAEGSARIVNAHPHAEVIAIQDTNAERANALADKCSISHVYNEVEDLLANPDVDAVYVAVPNKFHVPFAIAALQAGKHVILEKPFAMSYEEAKSAVAVAKETGKVLTLGMNMRFGKMAQTMRKLAQEGTFGEIYHAKACWMRRTGIPRLGTWFGSKALAGSGCLYDIGVHVLDLCLFVTNKFKPVRVTGATYTKFGNKGLGEGGWGRSERTEIPFDVEDLATGLITLDDGSTIALDVAWACHIDSASRSEVELFGTQAGGKVIAGKIFQPDENTNEYLTREVITKDVPYPHGDRFHNFINHLRGEEELCVSLDQALVVQQILTALEESAVTGREVLL